MSAREVEMQQVKAAERSSGISSSQARTTHMGDIVGCPWSDEVKEAVASLSAPDNVEANLVVIVSVDQSIVDIRDTDVMRYSGSMVQMKH